MSKLSLSQLSVAEKDALIEGLLVQIEVLRLRIADLEGRGEGGGPLKTSRNSHLPPSRDMAPPAKAAKPKAPGRKRPGPGVSRRLSSSPTRTVRVSACACGKCGADVSGQRQGVRRRYDRIEIPPIVARYHAH